MATKEEVSRNFRVWINLAPKSAAPFWQHATDDSSKAATTQDKAREKAHAIRAVYARRRQYAQVAVCVGDEEPTDDTVVTLLTVWPSTNVRPRDPADRLTGYTKARLLQLLLDAEPSIRRDAPSKWTKAQLVAKLNAIVGIRGGK